MATQMLVSHRSASYQKVVGLLDLFEVASATANIGAMEKALGLLQNIVLADALLLRFGSAEEVDHYLASARLVIDDAKDRRRKRW